VKSAKYFSFIFLSAVMFLVAGCRTLKAPPKPDEMWVTPEWEKSAKSKDVIWESIREKGSDITQPLTLYELVGIALRNNPNTRGAWQKARAAEAKIKQAQSTSYPQLTGKMDFTKDKVVTNREADKKNVRDFGGLLKATYLILDFGGRSAEIEQATQLTLEANFLFNQAIQDLFLDTATGYYTYYSSKSNVEAAEADVENTRSSYEAAQVRLTAGLGVKLDVLQTKSDYENALYGLEEAKALRQSAKANLAKVLGFSADTDFEIVNPPKLPENISQENVSDLIDAALQQRPDIAAGRANLRAKKAAVKSANSDLWPTLNVGGSMGSTRYDYFGTNKASTVDNAYMGYLSIEWDIFDGFNNLAIRREVQAEADAEREKLMQAELEASADVWTKYYNYQTSVKKRKFSEASYDSSVESYDLALEGYKAGLKNILDLIEAQRSLSGARSNLIESERDMFVSLAELIHATGTIGTRGQTATTGTEPQENL
jgi:outer membrane protein